MDEKDQLSIEEPEEIQKQQMHNTDPEILSDGSDEIHDSISEIHSNSESESNHQSSTNNNSDEKDKDDEKDKPHKKETTFFETVMNCLNSLIGAGILSVPNSFISVGLVPSLILITFMAFLS